MARDLRARLPRPRARPLLLSGCAALLGEDGLFGVRRRASVGGFLLRSIPASMAAACAVLVLLGVFSEAPAGGRSLCALSLLGFAAVGMTARRIQAKVSGRQVTWREELEVGSLLVLLAFALAQAGGTESGGPQGPLGPLVYLAVAVLAALLPIELGGALVALAISLETGIWWLRGAPSSALLDLAARTFFLVVFAGLFHAILGGRMAAWRRAELAAVERRKRHLDERARELRLLAVDGEAGEGGRDERAARLAEASVLESNAAARGLLEIAGSALRADTVGVWLLSQNDEELRLWECRSVVDRVADRLPAGEGPLGGVVKGGGPLRLHGDARTNHYSDGVRPESLVAVPLRARTTGQVRGVVLADRLQGEAFSDGDEVLLEKIAAELARAAAAECLIRDGRASREEKERFYQAIERLNRRAKPREVFDTVLEVASEMVPLDFGAVTLFETVEERGQHRVARAVVFSGGEGRPQGRSPAATTSDLEGRVFPQNRGFVDCAVELASSLPVKYVRLADSVVFDDASRLKGYSSLKVLPLKAAGTVLGTLVVAARTARAYGPEAVRQLEVTAIQAADAILRAQLFEETERLATIDGLTGLVNHRTFQARLDEHLAAAQRYGKNLSLLFTDVDHFKNVNDTYGHPVGDLVLKGVARIMQREARTTDIAARYGGEEFSLVMPETDRDGALRTAERIRQKVAESVFRCEQGELKVTISIGIATFPMDGTRKADLIELADAGLYHAKRHGRNQSVALGSPRAAKRSSGM